VFVNPAIFTVDGTTQGDITNEDGGRNNAAHPAEPGSIVTIIATGEGVTDPPSLDGQIFGDDPPKPAVLPVMVWMEGKEAEVISFGGVPGMPAGLLQVKARIPMDVTRGGPVAVTIGVNANYTPDLVTVAVKP
jgi:uncharacterized protein (TIGR03437 family)